MAPGADGRYLSEWLGAPLTDEQLAIATHPLTPQLVVAGAGSGKTTVLAARVIHLVAHHGIAPSRILGLTFTNKASANLAASVARALRQLPPSVERGDWAYDDQPTVATYHAYAAGLVRDHALRIGREPVTQLLSQASRWQVAMRVVQSWAERFHYLNWTPAYLARFVLALDAEMSEHLVEEADVARFDAQVAAGIDAIGNPTKGVRDVRDAALARDELLDLVAAYRRRKAELDLLDFGDQVALAAEVVRRAPEVVRLERDRFAVVVLDEYQDTGVAQRVMLSALYGDGHPVTAVGDPNQAIYGWRGASMGNLLRFGEHFAPAGQASVDPQPLLTSFRCGGRILDVANALAHPLHESPAAVRRPMIDVPGLVAPAERAEHGETVIALLRSETDEATWLARQVRRALDEGVRAGEVAVLCRARSDFPWLRDALVSVGVPVEVVGLGGLLTTPEVSDVVATLRVLIDPVANGALVRLLTGPRWRIGVRDLAALGRRAGWLVHEDNAAPDEPSDEDAALREATRAIDPVEVASLLDALDSPGDVSAYAPDALTRMALLRDELRGLRALLGQPILEVVTEVVARTGLGVEIEAMPPAQAVARAANLAAFADQAAYFSGLEGESDLRAFLAFLDAAADEENGLDVGAVPATDTVKLLTVHKAKGLEWDVVAIPSLTDGVFPASKGRSRWTTSAYVLPYALRGDADDLPAEPRFDAKGLEAFAKECKADDSDEERRLVYVAATRARARLIACGSWWTDTRKTRAGPSPFLAELYALGQRGLVRVDAWAAPPADGEPNPLGDDARVPVAWPVMLDSGPLTARLEGAELVRQARRGALGESTPLVGADNDLARSWIGERGLLLAEIAAAARPQRAVDLPRRLTASQVVALAADPATLAHELARPMPARPSRSARRGTRFHTWVQQRFEERPLLDPEDLPGAGDPDDVDDETLVSLQEAFLASPYADMPPVAIEAPFELVVGGRLLRGRIDAVYRDGAGFDVIDYKTGAVPADFGAASLQLSIYRLAWADLAGVPPESVKAGFLYVARGAVKRPDVLLSRDQLESLIAPLPAVTG